MAEGSLLDIIRFLGAVTGKDEASGARQIGVDAKGNPVYKTGFWDSLYGGAGGQLNTMASMQEAARRRALEDIGTTKKATTAAEIKSGQDKTLAEAEFYKGLLLSPDPALRSMGEKYQALQDVDLQTAKILQEVMKDPSAKAAALAGNWKRVFEAAGALASAQGTAASTGKTIAETQEIPVEGQSSRALRTAQIAQQAEKMGWEQIDKSIENIRQANLDRQRKAESEANIKLAEAQARNLEDKGTILGPGSMLLRGSGEYLANPYAYDRNVTDFGGISIPGTPTRTTGEPLRGQIVPRSEAARIAGPSALTAATPPPSLRIPQGAPGIPTGGFSVAPYMGTAAQMPVAPGGIPGVQNNPLLPPVMPRQNSNISRLLEVIPGAAKFLGEDILKYILGPKLTTAEKKK